VEAVERRASLKRWLGHPLFVSAAISTWSTGYDRSRPHYELTTNDGRTVADGFFTVVLNTDPYTYLGNRPLGLSSEAGLERPLVAVTFRTLDIVTILRGLGAAWRGAGVADGDRLVEWTDVRTLAVDGVEPFPYQVDGDFLGETKHLRFEHVPDAVRLAFPAR
jgi:diacylglycerol kinase family enzyme